jgi:hypothetical protein
LFGGIIRERTRYVSMSLTFEGQDANYWQLLIASLALTKTFDAIADALMKKILCFHCRLSPTLKQSWSLSYIALEISEMYKFCTTCSIYV